MKQSILKVTPIVLACCLLVAISSGNDKPMRPLEELINTADPGWVVVKGWVENAKNEITILKKDPARAEKALYQTQVTTRSPMGAIIYETGGILVDHGWIRILGSGSDKFNRSLPEWNEGRSSRESGKAPSFLLIADDAIGGFFAINGGAFGKDDLGKVYYFAPDRLEWESLKVGYSEFVNWTFTGDLELFYKGFRWKGWKAEINKLSPDQTVSFAPFLWTKYKSIEVLNRKHVPVEEIWSLQLDVRKQLLDRER